MDMMMPVHKIGGAVERLEKLLHLTPNFRSQRGAIELVHDRAPRGRRERREGSPAHRLEGLAQRTKRRGQRDVKPDRHPRRCGIEHIKSDCLRAMKARCRHQRRGGVEASAHHEVADCGADRGGDSVVVRAEPDAPLGLPHSAAERAGAWLEAPALSAVLSVCSATKWAGRALSSERILPIYSPLIPIMMSCTPPSTIRPTTTDGEPGTASPHTTVSIM